MASRGGLSGLALAEIAAGVILAWSGIENASVTATLRSAIGGKKPAPDTGNQPVTTTAAAGNPAADLGALPGDTGASSASAAANQAIARLLAAPYGWSAGTEWTDLVSLWNRESGWSNTATNAASGAFGIAQALGHGTAGSQGTTVIDGSTHNEYPSQAANNGSAAAQIAWGLSYISQTYGSPHSAWAHEVANGWY